MGGRGGAGGGIGAGESGRGRGMSLARFLSQQDINRANAASVTDMGDIIRRTFERNAAEINGLELSDAEKKNAVRQMATLATTALKTAAGAVNPYASGPARLRGNDEAAISGMGDILRKSSGRMRLEHYPREAAL